MLLEQFAALVNQLFLHLQQAGGMPRAERIDETNGVYPGQLRPLYRRFYDFPGALALERVTSERGKILMAAAGRVLQARHEKTGAPLDVRVPYETSRRVGSAVAAALLPALNKPGAF